jgi:hypothetical protein
MKIQQKKTKQKKTAGAWAELGKIIVWFYSYIIHRWKEQDYHTLIVFRNGFRSD